MKKRFLAVLVTGLFLLTMTGMANAALTTIGTATYGGENYNLIHDKDNNGNSIVWLDYSNAQTNWTAQKAWAAGLDDSNLTYNLNSGYSVAWDDAAWRLPSAGVDVDPQGGYNQTTSEMGDLFYNELGLSAYPPLTTTAQLNATNFDNLIASRYWSGTAYAWYPSNAWFFYMHRGYQSKYLLNSNEYALAVRSGHVSAVPVPGAIWLLGSGLVGVVVLGRRRKGNRV